MRRRPAIGRIGPSAIVLAGALIALGACRVQMPITNDPTGARSSRLDWSLRINELMPAIRACTENAARQGASVQKAWLMNDDKVGVRMTDVTGKRVDCIADRGGGQIDSVAELVAGDILPSEGRPTFYPVGRGQPLCQGLAPVVINGIQEGWLRDVPCR